MYTYKFTADRIIDGDTVEVTIDLGFNTFRKAIIRLVEIDAPETRGRSDEEEEAGERAKQWLTGRLFNTEDMLLTTKGKGSFGRWLGTIQDGETNINQQMVELGLAWKWGDPKELSALNLGE